MQQIIELIKIELSPADIEWFKIFLKYKDPFQRLHKEGVLDLRSGKALLHFDSAGHLRRIVIDRNVSDTSFGA